MAARGARAAADKSRAHRTPRPRARFRPREPGRETLRAALRDQNSNVIYAISDEPLSAEEWKKQYVTGR